MIWVLSFLPAILFAFTISTTVKVGDDVCTNVDVSHHKILSERLKMETQSSVLAPEDTLEGKALIKSYLEINRLRFSPPEREALFQMHIQRMGVDLSRFEQYLKENGLSKEAFVDEIVYRQEVLRWMVQTYSWKEVVTRAEIEGLRKKLSSEADQAGQGLITFDVVKLKNKSDFPLEINDDFWRNHAKESVVYRDASLTKVPEPYEAFLRSHRVGDVSPPFEALGSWHMIRILSKQVVNIPSDALLRNYLMEQKCMKHLSVWTKEQLSWMYKDK